MLRIRIRAIPLSFSCDYLSDMPWKMDLFWKLLFAQKLKLGDFYSFLEEKVLKIETFFDMRLSENSTAAEVFSRLNRWP